MADSATDVQHVSQVLVAVTVAALASVQLKTAEFVEMLVQKVMEVQHSVMV